MAELPRRESFENAVAVPAAKVADQPAGPPPASPPEAPASQAPAPQAPASQAPASQAPPSRGRLLRRAGIGVAVLAGLGAGGVYGHDYWTTGRFMVSTDDAYVQADYTVIAPKVAGYISAVEVADNQPVKAGQVLARIDDHDYRAALDAARADVTGTEASLHNLDAQIELQRAEIDQAQATVVASQATLTYADQDATRYQNLVTSGAGSLQRAQQSRSARDTAAAGLQRDRAAVISAQRRIAVLATMREQTLATRERARAAERQAELNLGYTTITAPMAGMVGARTLRVGQYVAVGTQLMAVVPTDATYVVANYKETQLADVHAGQPVDVEVDGLSGPALKGHVDSVSPASGLEFALLPPDNATGNFTKIVQRIPVKIVLDGAHAPLRAGMSVEPSIDTRAHADTQGEARAAPAKR